MHKMTFMKTLLIGAGRIGSVFGFCLSNAGHEVTVIARGERFEALQNAGAIVTTDGRKAPVKVIPELDSVTWYDLVIVTVPEHQLAPLLPQIAQCQARTILFMFNTFHGSDRYKPVISADRLAFGFPNMTAYLDDQRLRYRIDGSGMVTTVSRPDLATLFARAGMPSEFEPDMDAFLRSHVALAVPLFLAGLQLWGTNRNLTWKEARCLQAAWQEGFDLVESLGHPLKPRMVSVLARMPSFFRTCFMLAFSRSELVKGVGVFGPSETRYLIDTMAAAKPGATQTLSSLKP